MVFRKLCWQIMSGLVVVMSLIGQSAHAQRVEGYALGESSFALDSNWQSGDSSNAAALATRPLSQIDLSIQPELPAPNNLSAAKHESLTARPSEVWFNWEATNLGYKNLIFEEPLLERHGFSSHSRIQPVISGMNFYTHGLLYPIKVIRGKNKCGDNPLGWGTPRL